MSSPSNLENITSSYWKPPHDPVSTRPSRITGTMDEWDAWVAGLTRRDKDRLYPGMHTSLIAATEKITGMDEGEYPDYAAPQKPVIKTNAWGQPIEDPVNTPAWGTPKPAATPPLTQTGFGPQRLTPPSPLALNPSPADPWAAPSWSTTSQPKRKLGILDQSLVPANTPPNSPQRTNDFGSLNAKPWLPRTPPAMTPGFGTPGLTISNPGTAQVIQTGFGPQRITPPMNPWAVDPKPTAPLQADPWAAPSWSTPSQPKRKLGILDQSFVKPAQVQNPSTDTAASSFDLITGAAINGPDTLGNTGMPQVYNAAPLLSGVAGDTLNAGTALATTFGKGENVDGSKDEKPGQETARSDAYDSKVNLQHEPSSNTFIWTPVGEKPRSVTPFSDDIPGFNWHRDRNHFNRAPRVEPRPVRKNIKTNDGWDTVVSHYVDHQNNKWNRDATGWWHHGLGNQVYRGTGKNQGSQIVYKSRKDGVGNKTSFLLDSGPDMGTFDYGRPVAPWGDHRKMDMKNHDRSKPYTPNITLVY